MPRSKRKSRGSNKELRAAPFVSADETSWRENGQSECVWSFSTPTLRYFRYRKSRAAAVPEAVLGSDYGGPLVSDFYAAYGFHWGLHQRCGVHLLRDLEELAQKQPTDSVKNGWKA